MECGGHGSLSGRQGGSLRSTDQLEGLQMQPYSLFISYLQNPLSGTSKKMPPLVIQAVSEEEAARTAVAIADFAYPEFTRELLIRVVGAQDTDRPIADIRRPLET